LPVELRQLRYIVAAASHRSFRHAAASLGVKQSTLSRAVRTVEERLDVTLFERNNGGARLTPAGQSFVQGAELIVGTVADIVCGAKAAGRGESGRLAIGCHSVQAAPHLHALIADFRTGSPDAEIVVSEGSRDRLLAQLGAGSLDVAILSGDPGVADLAVTSAWMSRLVAVLPLDHALARREPLHWADLAGATLLASRGDPGHEVAALARAKLGSPEMQPSIAWHDVAHTALPRLAALGLGVALVCESSLDPDLPVVVRDIRDGAGMIGLSYVVAYRRRYRNPMLKRFLRMLGGRYPSSRPPDLAAE
jgi:DNA-binding transcriptional LysR family regulator